MYECMKGDADFKHEDEILYLQAKKVSIKSKERDITVTVDGEPILRNGIIQQKHYSC
jgi:diacylglycerol kinase family enzyme